MVNGIFTSGGPDPRQRFSNWAHTYRLPLSVSGGFVVLLLVFVVLPNPSGSVPEGSPTPSPDVTPAPRCPACGLGEACDETTGTCVLVEATPRTCVGNADYDAEEDRCIPRPTPTPTPFPSKTLEPGATPRVPIGPQVTEQPDPTEPPETPSATTTPEPTPDEDD